MKKFSLLLISLLICSGASFAATAPGAVGDLGGLSLVKEYPSKLHGTVGSGIICLNVPNLLCFTVYDPDKMSNLITPLNPQGGVPVPSMVVFNNDENDTDGDEVEAIVDVDAVVKIDLEDSMITKYVIKTKPTTRKVSEREAFKWLYEECQTIDARNDQLQQMARP